MKRKPSSAGNPVKTIYGILHRSFGYRNWWPIVRGGRCLYLPEFRSRQRTAGEILEIMVGALLTQNAAWSNVVKSLAVLKERKLLGWKRLLAVPQKQLSDRVRSSGYFNQKAKKIKALARFIKTDLRGSINRLKKYSPAEAREKLLSVWGIGKETADSILLYGYSMPVFVVDAYTRRVFSRLGLIDKNGEYDRVRGFFESRLKKDPVIYGEYHALIVETGKTFCKNRPLCASCPLSGICLSCLK